MEKLPKRGQYKWDNFPDNGIINNRGILENGLVLCKGLLLRNSMGFVIIQTVFICRLNVAFELWLYV